MSSDGGAPITASDPAQAYRGATAVVTGGASGIGRALVEALARRGADVTLVDLQLDQAETVAAGIRAQGGLARAAIADVRDHAALSAVVRDAFERTGRLDFMFNNAGIALMGGANSSHIDDWHRVLDVNLGGVVNGTKIAYAIMIERGCGHIVNTASVAGLTPHPGSVAYATAKHGIVGLSKSLRSEAARKGVRVSVLCPGPTETPLLSGGAFGTIHPDIPEDKLRAIWRRMQPASADRLAEVALDGVARNKAVIVWPAKWKAFWLLDRLSPSLSLAVARRVYESNLRFLGLE